MKSKSEKKTANTFFKSQNWFVIRAPTLSFSESLNSKNISELIKRPEIHRALAVGSPNLLQNFQRADENDTDIELKISRYVRRMATRTTPYGLFSGVALGDWGNYTNIEFSPDHMKSFTRLGLDVIDSIISTLESKLEFVHQTRLWTNPSLEIVGDRILVRIAKKVPISGKISISNRSVRLTESVAVVINSSKKQISFQALKTILEKNFPKKNSDQIENFIIELISSKVLLTDIKPNISGSDPFQQFLNRLEKFDSSSEIVALQERLTNIKQKCLDFDCQGDNDGSEFLTMLGLVRELVSPSQSDPYCVDTKLLLKEKSLSSNIREEVERAADLLLRLTPQPNGSEWLRSVHNLFIKSYGYHRDVRIIDFISEHNSFFQKNEGDKLKTTQFNARDRTLLELAANAIRERTGILYLNDEIIKRLETRDPSLCNLPCSIDLAVVICANTANDINLGKYDLLISPIIGARQAGRLLGRFQHLLGEPAKENLKSLSVDEALNLGSNIIAAELIYESVRPRWNNVLACPSNRNFQVVINNQGTVEEDCAISPEEILIGSRDGSLSIFWAKDGREILPRVRHMLSSDTEPPLIRLLCELAVGRVALLSRFDWGSAEHLPALPRVVRDRIILRPAQWTVMTGLITSLKLLSAWRENWSVPDIVYVGANDVRLIVDFQNDGHIHDLLVDIRRRDPDSYLTFYEALPSERHAWVPSRYGLHTAEFIFPLLRRAGPLSNSLSKFETRYVMASDDERVKKPGSEWLFISLFAEENELDAILCGPLLEFVQSVIKDGFAKSWFFIKYADPSSHIRLRFTGDPQLLTLDLWPKLLLLCNALIKTKVLQKYTLDFYDREIERYGGLRGIELAELIFSADSLAVAHTVKEVKNFRDLYSREILGAVMVNFFMDDFDLSSNEKISILSLCCNKKDRLAGQIFRQKKELLRKTLRSDILSREFGLVDVLQQRKREIANIKLQLLASNESGEMFCTLYDLMPHFVHMHCNRLFGTNRQLEDTILSLSLKTLTSINSHP